MMKHCASCGLTAVAIFLVSLVGSLSWADDVLTGFVEIQGGTFRRGRGADQKGSPTRVEDFEMLDHPVTNQEYGQFVRATGHRCPLHWQDGMPPAGREDDPVIFVNRSDVLAYLDWLTVQTGRICRLPTAAEFEYASRGGRTGAMYPWGDEEPARRANYDATGQRSFAAWKDHLRPARFGVANGFGLCGMSGNVWQMVCENHDPATTRFKYRIDDPLVIESSVMGGSWARGEEYLRCGYRLSISAGICHPDLGFRPVREPRQADWAVQPRRLAGVALGENRILLSWALLQHDQADTGFHVYRAGSRDHAGFRLTTTPITVSTTFVDSDVKQDARYHYYVRAVDPQGKEGRRSEWCGVTGRQESDVAVAQFEPICHQGSLVPMFGDLNGDGALDCVVRMDNGNTEMSQDPGVPVQIEAFTSYGRSLWRKDICRHAHCYGSANNVPVNVWDMDGDGRAEVMTRLQIDDAVWVAVLDGMSGQVKHQVPWPDMVSDFAKSSTRIHMSIAYLDGQHPAVVTQTGLYENEVFAAYDARLKPLWRFNSFAETSGSGGHKIEVVDVDGDGRQEVFDGTTCLNHDGSVRWSIYRQHPDIVNVADYLPERPGLEVFFIVESSVHAGVYMVDANTGEVIWKVNREDDRRWTHGHYGWTSDIWDGSPGIECISNRAGHEDGNIVLFAADGRVLLEPFPGRYTPLEWDGDATRELRGGPRSEIGDFNGREVVFDNQVQPQLPPGSSLLYAADVCGDFRDELIVAVPREDGGKSVAVVMATHDIQHRFVAPAETLDYRLWLARNMGGGYPSIHFQPLQ